MARLDSDMTVGNIWMHMIRYSRSVLVRGTEGRP